MPWTTWSTPICSSGRIRKPKAVIDEMNGVTGFTETFIAGPYALAASPARYAVERGDWKAAAALEVRPSSAGSRAGGQSFCASARRCPLGRS